MEFAQKLISTRRGSLYLAVIAAVLAGVSILVYVNRYRSSVNAGSTPVTVLVARQAIPKGTLGSVIAARHLFTATTIRESQLRDGAFSDTSSLRGEVAASDIYSGAQLTAADFTSAGKSLADGLTGDQRVVSIPFDAAHGLIGDLSVGDHVDVYAGFNVIPLRADGTPLNGGQARPVLRLILPNVPVLGISNGGGIGSKPTTISLRADDQGAAKLAFASDNGKLWLSLRPSGGGSASRPGVVTIESLLLGIPPITVLHTLGGRS